MSCYGASESRPPLCSLSGHARQAQLGDIVREDAVDVVELRVCERFLRLYDFDIVTHAGVEALTGQIQRSPAT